MTVDCMKLCTVESHIVAAESDVQSLLQQINMVSCEFSHEFSKCANFYSAQKTAA